MKVAFIGLGKLGLPLAIAVAGRGHEVYGFDVEPCVLERCERGVTELFEPGLDEQLRLARRQLHFMPSLEDAVEAADDIIFVAVQTPHNAWLDGSSPFEQKRLQDFNYSYLEEAVRQIGRVRPLEGEARKTLAIISTVLPGTMRKVVYPALMDGRETDRPPYFLCYTPCFTGMGSTIGNYLNPEFSIIGGESPMGTESLASFFDTIHEAPKLVMTWEEAEMVKLCYNTFLGMKIVAANTVMEICDGVNADCDVVLGSLQKATDRVVGPRYMKGGMGDGGPCHPRDLVAMGFLSQQLGMNYNLFADILRIRTEQAARIADLLVDYRRSRDLHTIAILGVTYKTGTNLDDGSASLLVANLLREKYGILPHLYDPILFPTTIEEPAVFLVATPWPELKTMQFAPRSVVVDPWGFLEQVPDNVELVRFGRHGR